ncbi:hypothetical protein S83_051906 [Arachis hypogaea]
MTLITYDTHHLRLLTVAIDRRPPITTHHSPLTTSHHSPFTIDTHHLCHCHHCTDRRSSSLSCTNRRCVTLTVVISVQLIITLFVLTSLNMCE